MVYTTQMVFGTTTCIGLIIPFANWYQLYQEEQQYWLDTSVRHWKSLLRPNVHSITFNDEAERTAYTSMINQGQSLNFSIENIDFV